jgi:hypothetical protein
MLDNCSENKNIPAATVRTLLRDEVTGRSVLVSILPKRIFCCAVVKANNTPQSSPYQEIIVSDFSPIKSKNITRDKTRQKALIQNVEWRELYPLKVGILKSAVEIPTAIAATVA